MFGIWRITPARRRRLIRPTRAGLVKPHGQVGFGACLEYAIDHHAVEMEVRIKPPKRWTKATAPMRWGFLETLGKRRAVLHRREKDVQGEVQDGGGGLQGIAQSLGHREHP